MELHWRLHRRNVDQQGGPRRMLTDQPRLIPVMVEPPPLVPQSEPVVPNACPAVITWADGTRLEVPAGYPASAVKALIGALRPPR